MPYKSRKFCLQAGCPNIVNAGEGYCPEHKRARRKSRYKSDRHYDYQWRKLRGVFLSMFPLCHDCEKAGRLTPATEVHHIVAIADGGTDNFDNLMGLCKSCHSRRTALETNFGR